MTAGGFQFDASQRSIASLLRAVALLLYELAGDEPEAPLGGMRPRMYPPVRRTVTRAPRQRELSRMERDEPLMDEYTPPATPRTRSGYPSPGGQSRAEQAASGPDVELLLADARARAQAVLDESMEKARELLARPHTVSPLAEGDRQTLERIRHTVTDLVAEMRSLNERLDRMEDLLRAPARPEPGRPDPSRVDPVVPQVSTAQTSSPQSAVTPAPAISRPASSPPGISPQPVPPAPALEVRAAPQPPVPPIPLPAAPAPARSPVATDVPAPAVPSPESERVPLSANGSESAPQVSASGTFTPELGPFLLRVSPVAGFQGLMRVQEALMRIPLVRDAGVEAYAQGEARLRLQIAQPVDPESLAADLADRLGRPVRLEQASTADRIVRLLLE